MFNVCHLPELHHKLDGPDDAPVLVLSNSLGTELEMWDRQMPALTDRFRVLRYDSRGHGRSPVPDGPYSMADLGGDVVELLDRLEIGRASVCGISIGGMVALWLGVNAPERIDRLALCCTAAQVLSEKDWAERAATVREHGVVALADTTIDRWFSPEFQEDGARGGGLGPRTRWWARPPRATRAAPRRSAATTCASNWARSPPPRW